MAKFKLVPYVFRIHPKSDQTTTCPFDDFDGKGNDFLDFLSNKLKDDFDSGYEHVFSNSKKTISIESSVCEDRIIYGTLRSGEYGIEGSFFDVDTNSEISNLKREESYSERYPYFYLAYVPENSSRGILIMEKFKTFGVKTVFSNVLNKYLRGNERIIEIHPVVSGSLLDKIEKSRLIEFNMIRYEVNQDVCENFNPRDPKDIHEVHSIIANRNKEIELSQRLKDMLISETETGYYEILGEKYDEVKVLIEIDRMKQILTFGQHEKKYRESMPLSDDIALEGGFLPQNYVLSNAKRYLEYLIENIGDA